MCDQGNFRKNTSWRAEMCIRDRFWNFSHYDLSVHFPDAVIENVHLGDSLLTLSYRVSELEEKE